MQNTETETTERGVINALFIGQLHKEANDCAIEHFRGEKSGDGQSYIKMLQADLDSKLKTPNNEPVNIRYAYMSNDSHQAEALIYIFLFVGEAPVPASDTFVPILPEVESAIALAFSKMSIFGHIHNIAELNSMYTENAWVHVGNPGSDTSRFIKHGLDGLSAQDRNAVLHDLEEIDRLQDESE